MSVGFEPRTKQDVDNRSGDLATRTRNLVAELQQFGAWLAGQTDVVLQALPSTQGPQYVQADTDLLKSAFTQLVQGCAVLTGQATQATANNFLFFSNQIAQP